VSSSTVAPRVVVERHYAPDPERQAAALLVLLARRAVDEAVEADQIDAPTPCDGEG
jgi:hypothetical protein